MKYFFVYLGASVDLLPLFDVYKVISAYRPGNIYYGSSLKTKRLFCFV